MRSASRISVALGGSALSLAACQLLVGIDDEGVARPLDAGTPPAPRCARHVPPSPPEAAAPGAERDYTFAVHTVSLPPSTAPTLGYDLDGHCTGGADASPGDVPCSSGKVTLDGDGGIDNALASALASLHDVTGDEDLVGRSGTDQAQSGHFTTLCRLFGYNGAEDDAPGLVSTGCGQRGPDAGPRWDGCDRWSHVHAPTIGEDGASLRPSARAGTGYVRDGVLVASAATFSFLAGIVLHDAVITAMIDRSQAGRAVLRDGVFTGRLSPADILDNFKYFLIRKQRVCNQANIPESLLLGLCESRDVRRSRASDDTGGACDALSGAIAFDAVEALVGPAVDAPPLPTDCPPFDASCP